LGELLAKGVSLHQALWSQWKLRAASEFLATKWVIGIARSLGKLAFIGGPKIRGVPKLGWLPSIVIIIEAVEALGHV
jgi:hypothetical protein